MGITLSSGKPSYSGENVTLTGYINITEIASPTAPATNGLNLHAKDFGGVTTLYSQDSAGTLVPLNPGTSTLSTKTADYTLAIGDIGGIIEMSSSSAHTITVPPNSSVAFPTGTRIDIVQFGSGKLSIAAGSGVTIRSRNSYLNLAGQFAGATLYKRNTDEWVLIGDLMA